MLQPLPLPELLDQLRTVAQAEPTNQQLQAACDALAASLTPRQAPKAEAA